MSTTTATGITVDRKPLIRALEQVARVIPNRCTKPILSCVRIEARNGLLKLAVTDLETALMVQVAGEGELEPCLVSCHDLLKRVRAGKGNTCVIAQEADHLVVNGGSVCHRLQTEPMKAYPPLVFRQEGQQLTALMGSFRETLKVALVAAARESTRYAINGVLLEVSKGARLVATDGRRMAACELPEPTESDGAFEVILPARFCRLLTRLMARREDEAIHIYVKPARNEKGEKTPSGIWAVGPDWVLQTLELDGRFPLWRDVMPRNESKFLLDRLELLALVREVSTAACDNAKGIQVRLESKRAVLSCRSPAGAESSGEMPCRFLGGGDSLILTGFNPNFLIDALGTFTAQNVIIEARQNTPGGREQVSHHAAVLADWTNGRIRWVIMPVSTNVPPGPVSLGSNYREDAA